MAPHSMYTSASLKCDIIVVVIPVPSEGNTRELSQLCIRSTALQSLIESPSKTQDYAGAAKGLLVSLVILTATGNVLRSLP